MNPYDFDFGDIFGAPADSKKKKKGKKKKKKAKAQPESPPPAAAQPLGNFGALSATQKAEQFLKRASNPQTTKRYVLCVLSARITMTVDSTALRLSLNLMKMPLV